MRRLRNGVLLAVITLLLCVAGDSVTAQRIDIVVKRYQFTPDHVTLKKDVPAVLVFRSEDVEHGIAIKELDVKADIHKGGETEVPVTPHAVGTFIGKCAHFCGTGHGRMQLTVDVSE